MTPEMAAAARAGFKWINTDGTSYLESMNVHATLFMTGMWAEVYPAEARRLAQWWDEHQAGICGVDIDADRAMPFATRVDWLVTDTAALCRGAGSITGVERRQDHLVRDGDDRINLVINRGADAGASAIALAGRNLAHATILGHDEISVHALLAHERVVMTKSAYDALAEVCGA